MSGSYPLQTIFEARLLEYLADEKLFSGFYIKPPHSDYFYHKNNPNRNTSIMHAITAAELSDSSTATVQAQLSELEFFPTDCPSDPSIASVAEAFTRETPKTVEQSTLIRRGDRIYFANLSHSSVIAKMEKPKGLIVDLRP